MSTDSTDLRRYLVDAGVRCLGYYFDGSGDSGGLQDFMVPDNPALPLSHHAEEALDDVLNDRTMWKVAPDLTSTIVTNDAWVRAYKLVCQYPEGEDTLQAMFYDALEEFPGDWINNAGGYGHVAIDLLTGESRIDGWQRVEDTESANCLSHPFASLEHDLTSQITQLLTST